MAEVVIYTTPTCPYCIGAVTMLTAKRVPFTRIDVSGDWAKRAWLEEVTGRSTVPQIFIDGEPVGGFTDMLALERSGELARRLAGTRAG